MPSDKTQEVHAGALDAQSMRYHELWLQRWFYARFFVREGASVPVVFSTPMDCVAHFKNLWADDNNPFKYLLDLKDEKGTPLYEPHPSPIRYPLISVMRRGIKFRPYQNFSLHNWRHLNWPTVSDAGPAVPGREQQGVGLLKCDLGNVTTSRMPMAFDYKFQVDHLCLRPDTQAFFVEKVLTQFWRGGGGMQTWMDIEYPGWGAQYVRLYLEGDVDQFAPDDATLNDKNVEFRTSFNLVLEGFSLDVDYQVKPVLWKLVERNRSATPKELENLLHPTLTTDLRLSGSNPVLDSRLDVPAAGTCQVAGLRAAYADAGTAHLRLGDPAVPASAGDNVVTPYFTPPALAPVSVVLTSDYDFGIASTWQLGVATFSSTT